MRTLWITAVAGLTLSMSAGAFAANRPIYKAPPLPVAPVYNWTGCYVGAGTGYGMFNEGTTLVTTTPLPGIPAGTTFIDGITQGGRGWLVTGQLGCDYQFAGQWVVGAFVDYDWTNIRGRHTGGDINIGLQQGDERLQSEWALGARIGWLFRPDFLTYFSAGYTQASMSEVNYVSAVYPTFGTSTGLQVPARTYRGWFVGGGVEYALPWLHGLYWKNEYRFAEYGTRDDTVLCTSAAACGAVGATAFAERSHLTVQTFRTELVWRFNSLR